MNSNSKTHITMQNSTRKRKSQQNTQRQMEELYIERENSKMEERKEENFQKIMNKRLSVKENSITLEKPENSEEVTKRNNFIFLYECYGLKGAPHDIDRKFASNSVCCKARSSCKNNNTQNICKTCQKEVCSSCMDDPCIGILKSRSKF